MKQILLAIASFIAAAIGIMILGLMCYGLYEMIHFIFVKFQLPKDAKGVTMFCIILSIMLTIAIYSTLRDRVFYNSKKPIYPGKSDPS